MLFTLSSISQKCLFENFLYTLAVDDLIVQYFTLYCQERTSNILQPHLQPPPKNCAQKRACHCWLNIRKPDEPAPFPLRVRVLRAAARGRMLAARPFVPITCLRETLIYSVWRRCFTFFETVENGRVHSCFKKRARHAKRNNCAFPGAS
ncbi:hypothetical protein [Desulfovibrio sp. 86]|uniref:hypothetical protein n=1 Tax=Desulfovibrio sp. 86 TaxID=2666132 RepID=UPI0015D36066|nr:hypothetical protein [Desulfovibrio sp. 86]